MEEKILCNNCGSTLTKRLFRLPKVNEFAGKKISPAIDGGYYVKCKKCFINFRNNSLDQNELSELYDEALSEWEIQDNRNDWKLLTQYISKKYKNEINILDIGCNRGDVLLKFDSNSKKYGFEINKSAAEIAGKHKELTIWTDFDSISEDLRFDVIYSTDVIEHILSPAEFLESLINKLNTGGTLILTTRDSQNVFARLFKSKWWYFYFPEHVAFISRKWLVHFAEANNLSIETYKNYFYNDLSRFKRLKLFILSISLFFLNSKTQTRILKLIDKSKIEKRLQIGRGFSRDHLFVALQKK